MHRAVRLILILLGFTYLIAMITLCSRMTSTGNLRRILNQQSVNTNYRFNNPNFALKVLSQLDLYEPVELGYTPSRAEKNFNLTLMGLKSDPEYCDKHRAFFVENTDFMFEEKNFLSSYQLGSNLRKHVIPALSGNDLMKNIFPFMQREIKRSHQYDIPLDTHVCFFFEPTFYIRRIDQQFSCQTQMSNHIPGHQNLYRKDHVGQALVQYSKKYETRPQCLNTQDKFFPRTWVLRHEEQCKDFFAEFNSPRYEQLKHERTIVYFRKVGYGVHQGKGVFPVNQEEETKIREKYANGTLCGQVNNSYIMQYFVHNPLLVYGRKADFRIPMLIASTNPLIVYYNDGFLRISLSEFSADSSEKGAFLTNLDLAEHAFSSARRFGRYNGKTEKELQDDLVWSFERVQQYLLDDGLITDNNWLNNYLRPEIKRMMVHLVRMSQSTFAKKSSLFEIFGVDVMLDENLNLWFIEANAKPGLEGSSEAAKDLFINFLTNSFEVLFGLLRSRTKRIIEYVNELERNVNAWDLNDGSAFVENLRIKRLEFKELTKNRFESEFKPNIRTKYGFSKIVDENYVGVRRYSGILSEECL